MPVSGVPIEHGFLAVANGIIQAVGRIADLPDGMTHGYDPAQDRTVLTPGLINVHTHLELTFADPEPSPAQLSGTMADWLINVVGRIRNPEAPDPLSRCISGVHQMLTTGTTCVNDVSSDGTSLAVLEETGMRGIISLECFHPAADPIAIKKIAFQYQLLADRYTGDPFRTVGLSPHSPYNVSAPAWKALLETCRPGLVHTHLAESQDELAWIARSGEPYGMDQLHASVLGQTYVPASLPGETPVAYLDRFGLLHPGLVVAHGIYTTPEDRALLKAHGVTLAHCPRSNAYLQGETLRWADWKDTGIPIALGTDSPLSLPAEATPLDLRQEARQAMAMHGWTAEEAWRRMTVEAAYVLGLQLRIGSLSPGLEADFVQWTLPVEAPGSLAETLLLPTTQWTASYVAGMPLAQVALSY